MRPVHYNKCSTSLYIAILDVLGAHGRGRQGRSTQDLEASLDTLEDFRAWLATTDGGHGLTAEPSAAFKAREEAGVSFKMDGKALVIRVRG